MRYTPSQLRNSPSQSPNRLSRLLPLAHAQPVSPVLQLQRTLGNSRVTKLLRANALAADGKIRRAQPALSAATTAVQYENLSGGKRQPPSYPRVIQPFKIQRKDTCSDSSSDEARWAGQNEGKVFKSGDKSSEPNEVILWNYCVGEKTLREKHRDSLKQETPRWKKLVVGDSKSPATRSDLRINIQGTASLSGNKDANEKIAMERAQAVKEFLEGEGIPGSFIITKGAGSQLPLADETSPENMARNRRIELTLFTPTVTADISALRSPRMLTGSALANRRLLFHPPPLTKALTRFQGLILPWLRQPMLISSGSQATRSDFISCSPGTEPIGLYVSEQDGSELLLDYGRCNTVLPCRDVLDATSLYSETAKVCFLGIPAQKVELWGYPTGRGPYFQ